MTGDFIAQLRAIDIALFHALNGYLGSSPVLDRIVGHLDDLMLKGLLFSATFGALWFQRTKSQTQVREILVLMVLAIVLSLVVARGFADLLPFRERTMLLAGFRRPLFDWQPYFENWSSFPSDTAAVVFSMATGFWLASRWLGLLWAGFAVASITARVSLVARTAAPVSIRCSRMPAGAVSTL